jgi:multidrug resistance efflux pump
MVDTTAAGESTPVSSGPEASQPPTPPPAPPRNRLRKWRARFIVLILLVAAVYFGLRVSQRNEFKAAQIDLGTVTLTSQVIPVETARPGQVMTIDVAAQQKVNAGDQLGTLQVITTNSEGKPVISTLSISAPRSGIVVDDPVTVGSTLQPGQPLVQLYDPTKLTFSGQLPLTNLADIGPGMVATLTAEGLKSSIKATVQRVVPRVGSNQTDVRANFLKVVLVPQKPAEVAALVPGLRFTGKVDTGTGPRNRKKLVYIGS